MARTALKTARQLADVVDDMALAKEAASRADKDCKRLEIELATYLGDAIKQDGVYQGRRYTLTLKRSDPAPMYLDNLKVLALIGATAYEKCKSPRETVRKIFTKREK